jgi:hypothetical protein
MEATTIDHLPDEVRTINRQAILADKFLKDVFSFLGAQFDFQSSQLPRTLAPESSVPALPEGHRKRRDVHANCEISGIPVWAAMVPKSTS